MKPNAISKILQQNVFINFIRLMWKFPYHTLKDFPEDVYFTHTRSDIGLKRRGLVFMEPISSQSDRDPNLFSKEELEKITEKEMLLFSMIHFHGVKEEMLKY